MLALTEARFCPKCQAKQPHSRVQVPLRRFLQSVIDEHDIYDSPFTYTCQPCGHTTIMWEYDR